LNELPLVDMVPDYAVVKHARGAYARALSARGREYAVYFDGKGPVGAILRLPAGTYSGEWIDTGTGSVLKAEQFRHAGEDKVLSRPDSRNGVALRLRRISGK
jgi:hypothetical protein